MVESTNRPVLANRRVLADRNRSDMHLTSGVVGVVRVRRSLKSGVHERCWPTQAQLMRSDSSKHQCPGQGVSLESCAAFSEKKVSQHSCVWFQRWSVSRSSFVV